jgi:hypothetical protein
LLKADKIANIIYIIGVASASTGINQREQSIFQTVKKHFSNHISAASKYNLDKYFALANWIYLVTGFIFINTAYASLQEKLAMEPVNASLSSKKSINGSKIVVLVNLSKIVGYIVTASGREIMASSIVEQKTDKYKNIFELELLQKNKLANILFILGITISFTALNKQVLSIKKTAVKPSLDHQESAVSKYNFEKSLALVNWIYLIAGLLYVYTSSTRLQDRIAARPRKSSSLLFEKGIRGNKMVVDGTIFKVIGYLSSALGREIIADSTIDPEVITDSNI